MRHTSFVLLAALLVPTAAAAQTGPQPTLVLSVFAGVATGHSLWTIPRQPVEQHDTAPQFQTFTPAVYDTLRLSRRVGTGLMGGMSALLFPSPHFGLEAEVTYMSLPLESACIGLYYDSVGTQHDREQKNHQLCSNMSGTHVSASALGAFVGFTIRAAPRGSISPYVRGGLGFTSLSRSTLAMEGQFISAGAQYAKAVIVDSKPKETSLSYVLGVGITSPLGPGYQFRLELRDVVASQTRATGQANGLGQVPSATKMYHHFALTMGLDVVLERKRGRRY